MTKIPLAEQIGHLDEVISETELAHSRTMNKQFYYRTERRLAALRATREALVWLMSHRDVAEAAARAALSEGDE